LLVALTLTSVTQIHGEVETQRPKAAPASSSSLPLPSSLDITEYESRLFGFLNRRQYKELGWATDKGVRDTGPYRNGKYYGTHPAVRIYYSPEIIAWLRDDKRRKIRRAMIVKKQFEAPAAHEGLDDDRLFGVFPVGRSW
jgi:hypothetical protein